MTAEKEEREGERERMTAESEQRKRMTAEREGRGGEREG